MQFNVPDINADQPQETVAVNSSAQSQGQTTEENNAPPQQFYIEEEHWIKTYWRPAMGWLYMMICFFDFIAFPFISMVLPLFYKKDNINVPYIVWQSLTLSNGGLIHISFAAILGVTAWTRGQEKIAKITIPNAL
jgi:hypothetical protein